MRTGGKPGTLVQGYLEMLGEHGPPVVAKCFTKVGSALHLLWAKAEVDRSELPAPE